MIINDDLNFEVDGSSYIPTGITTKGMNLIYTEKNISLEYLYDLGELQAIIA